MSAVHEAGRRSNAASGLAGWLSLAAAPTFAAMALVSAVSPGDPMAMRCMMTASYVSPLTGMAAMYVLMSAFHLALFPSLAILILVLAFNLIGDGLRDAIDPRLKDAS